MCDFAKFKEQIPTKCEFYSSLGSKGIIDEKYQHVPQFWKKFGMTIKKDYHN